MKDKLKDYLLAEKKESLLFFAFAILNILFGMACLFFLEREFWKGFLCPLFVISTFQLVVGSSLFFRTRKLKKILLLRLEKSPFLFTVEELSRMEKVNANLKLYRKVELLLFFPGLILIILGAFGNWGEFVLGLGICLAAQSVLLLILDLLAEMRAAHYTYELIAFKNRMTL